MIKVIWFLKRADGQSLAEFQHWWAHEHALQIAEAQRAYLKRYVVNLRQPEDRLVGKPGHELEWDGCAEQWFGSADDFAAANATAGMDEINADTGRRVSRIARMVVEEESIPLESWPSP